MKNERTLSVQERAFRQKKGSIFNMTTLCDSLDGQKLEILYLLKSLRLREFQYRFRGTRN